MIKPFDTKSMWIFLIRCQYDINVCYEGVVIMFGDHIILSLILIYLIVNDINCIAVGGYQ